MTVIRGAITIDHDDKQEIRDAVRTLLEEILSRNAIRADEILCAVFSNTADIRAYYPAKAAREAGFEFCSLFSAQEPDIVDSLPLCIRVMVFVERNFTPAHVYLRGAATLRRDLAEKMTIAIDGPSGSGKSTIARALAREYGILYLDTGAMYRACALKALQCGVSVETDEEAAALMRDLSLEIEYREGMQHTILDGKDVSEEIRRPEVSMAASTVSKFPAVRAKMVEKQREIAARMSCILDGRDIGTHVLPDADFKFFLTARAEIRAARRYEELTAKGFSVDLAALTEEIIARDLQDSTRAVSPLKKAADAIEIDTSEMTIDEVLSAIRQIIQEKI